MAVLNIIWRNTMDLAYKKYKACIVQRSKGKLMRTFTTWRGDIISSIIEKAITGTSFEIGDSFHIEIVPEDKEFEHISDEELGISKKVKEWGDPRQCVSFGTTACPQINNIDGVNCRKCMEKEV